MAFVAPATAERELFFEETAEAFWAVPHQCADGSTVDATLLVRSAWLQRNRYRGPGSHGQGAVPSGLPRRHLIQLGRTGGTGHDHEHSGPQERPRRRIRSCDIFGDPHAVTFNVTWTGVGPVETTVNVAGSKRKQRTATATGQVTFDGVVLVDGPNNHPTRPAPFIRVDTEK
jgi:hypothetical protein